VETNEICFLSVCDLGELTCSPPDLISDMGLMSYGISLRFSAIRTRQEQELRQYEYKMGCGSESEGVALIFSSHRLATSVFSMLATELVLKLGPFELCKSEKAG
jgi:hypothetical protein